MNDAFWPVKITVVMHLQVATNQTRRLLALGAPLAFSTLTACSQPPGSPSSNPAPVTQAALFANAGTVVYARVPPQEALPVRNVIQFLWSPSCRDSHRFYRTVIREAMLSPQVGSSDFFLISLLPRHERDLAVAEKLLRPGQLIYRKLVLRHLELGAREDRYLTSSDTDQIMAKLGVTSVTSELYDANAARQWASAINQFVRERLGKMNTPVLILNGDLQQETLFSSASDLLVKLRGA